MTKDISVLIPTYNHDCVALVTELQRQAALAGIDYEVIVADDGSTDQNTIESNRSINTLPHCRYIERESNVGRAVIRNFLAQQAQYPWLLFIDSDMVVCRQDFLRKYAEAEGQRVVDGGVVIGPLLPGNLRSLYEKAAEREHTVERRQETPYRDFHTANFLISHDVMLQHPFDSRFRRYGYEDVLLGKQLQEHGIGIDHIDNPLSFEVFETNDAFLSKTEEGIRTLLMFRDELAGYSRLLDFERQHPRWCLLLRWWHTLFGRWERQLLTGRHPRVWMFHLYRLGYFSTHR